MTELLEVLGQHLPAVERDLIVAGLHLHDLGTPKLSWVELESFVLMAPPGTATHTSRTGSWNADAQILAATQAQQYGKPPPGGVRNPNRGEPLQNMKGRRFPAPVPQDNPNRKTSSLLSNVKAIPLDQFREKMEARNRRWAEEAAAAAGQTAPPDEGA